jgi:HD-GYP domain-containing protein (c-di-GMP phosphodiesterase class II)
VIAAPARSAIERTTAAPAALSRVLWRHVRFVKERGTDRRRLFYVTSEGITALGLRACAHDSRGVRGDRRGLSDRLLATASRCCPERRPAARNALRLADQRLYAAKHTGRALARRQTSDVLLAVLRERHDSLDAHNDGVAAPAEQLAERLARAEEIETIRQAAAAA